MRVGSLFPSATETIAGIGGADDLVARSHQCDHPAAVLDAPVVTASTLSEEASSDAGDIDSVVDDHHHGDGTYFRVVTEELRRANPDVVVAQSLCDVCAVPESMTVEAMEALNPTPELVTLGPRTTDDILDAVERLGAAIDREPDADRLRRNLQGRIDEVVRRRPDSPSPPRVVCLEWTDALRCHGLWMPEIVEMLGAADGFGEPGARGRVVEWDDVVEYDPEVLVVSPCGRSVPEIRRDMRDLVDRPGWDELTAVTDDRVYLLSGKLSSRHGPRVVRALELMASIIYPDFEDVACTPEEVVRYRTGTTART